jgi:hypothetical protein
LAFNFRLQFMRLSRAILTGATLGLCAVARAVYAPIPDQAQGKDFSVTLEGGITYNTNIFGTATGDISSLIYEVAPKLSFNASISDSTFFSSDIAPKLDYFENRPGNKALYSQELDARIAHAYSKTSVADVSDVYSYDQNPEAIVNGAPVNSNQTLQSNEFDAHFSFSPTQKLGLIAKARSTYYDYIDPVLGTLLNRFENLYGLEGDYTLLPDVKAAFEYRHLDVDYSNNPGTNNKHSDFLMGGFDYNPGPKLTLSARLGGEYRHRDGLGDTTSPYAEASAKYEYGKDSFISTGYTYSLQETSDPSTYTDEKVNAMFVNVQHSFTPLFVGSASLSYSPAQLNARQGHANITEDTTAAGVALTYIPTKNVTVSATYDYDIVDSQVASRGFTRSRVGLTSTVVF